MEVGEIVGAAVGEAVKMTVGYDGVDARSRKVVDGCDEVETRQWKE